MQDNPYAAMVEVMRKIGAEGRPAVYRLGTVTNLSPLTVEAGGLYLSGADLLVNADLLPRTRPVAMEAPNAGLMGVTGKLEGTDKEEQSAALTVETGNLEGVFTLTGTLTEQAGSLTVGSRVVLLTVNDQLHVLLCKAVSV